jgi:2-polyprenyl-3-methyl-5-hydroxy-6-metoxy-1,4-benzoquinol methylase
VVSSKKYDLIWLSHVLEHSPTWVDARQLVSDVAGLLSPTGRIVIIGPDAQCWGREFWNIDATHGFPTTLRNVAQLADDVGLSVVKARHHRNANFGVVSKAMFVVLSVLPHRMIDRILTPERSKIGDGLLISWKAVFGWRQIFIVLSGTNLNK